MPAISLKEWSNTGTYCQGSSVQEPRGVQETRHWGTWFNGHGGDRLTR